MTKKALRQEKKKGPEADEKQRVGNARSAREEDIDINGDERFAKALNNPLFKKIDTEKHKVVLDDRFKAVLTDERFRILPGGNVDAYGRKIKKKSKEKQALHELQTYYTLEQPEGEAADGEQTEEANNEGMKEKAKINKPVKATPLNDEDKLDYLNKLARGEISADDDSDDSDDDEHAEDEEEEDEEQIDAEEEYGADFRSPLDIPGAEDEEEVEYGDATKRLSILNCDWENIKSQDLMMILQSFCPPGKQVKSVTIYPSDFGKERMAEEEEHGPLSIWKKELSKKKESANNDESEEDDEEEEDNEDLYDQVEDFGSDDDDDDDSNGEEDDDEEGDGGGREEKEFGDFRRKQGAVGLILHDDLKRRRQSEDNKKKKNRDNSKQPTSDVDEVALRQYELSKLRYYFAIAECDEVETANVLYEQLDDVELGDSAMAIELRFVPDDLDLSSREIRDQCHALPHSYKPPQFVINALQHTNVECSWDKGENEREKKLTNISSWRDLKESEFMQYIASSDSEDYDDEEDDEEEVEEEEEEGSKKRKNHRSSNKDQQSISSIKSLKKKKRAKQLRKLLLGDDENKNTANDDGDGHDDFFAQDPLENDDGDDGGPVPDENGEISMTYLPEAGEELIAKKKAKTEHLTPYEIELAKSAERKKQKKQSRKEIVQQRQLEQQQVLETAKQSYEQKRKNKKGDGKKSQQQEEEEEEFYMDYADEDRLISSDVALKPWELEQKEKTDRQQRKLTKKLQRQGKVAAVKEMENDGIIRKNIDTTDERFKKVFEGDDPNFGIDRTAHEFKSTPSMERILQEQRIRREKKQQKQVEATASNNQNNNNEVQSLANKLKRKFSAVN